MKLRLLVLAVFCMAPHLFAQSALPPSVPAPVYAESFRQGTTQVVEEKFEVKLTPQDRTYHERLRDSHGAERYDFFIVPRVPEGDTSISSWLVKLVDLQHRLYDNILMTSQQYSDDLANDPRTALWRLDPSKFAPVPAAAKRIIKVDGFYVVLQIKAFHCTPPDSPHLDSMTVAVQFTNTDPRSEESSEEGAPK